MDIHVFVCVCVCLCVFSCVFCVLVFQPWCQKIEAVNKMLEDLFMGMVVHRYRDVFPVIRRDVLIHYGHWIRNHQEMFLVNKCVSQPASEPAHDSLLLPTTVHASGE